MPNTPLVVAERLDLLDLLRELAPAEWNQPSLCRGWRVRDVVAHLVSYERSPRADLLRRAVRAGFRPDRMNALGVAELADLPPEQLVRMVEERLDPSSPATRFGGRVGLTDGLVHQQDIRRPLGRPRRIPSERLRVALSFALTAPPLRGAWRARGLALVAEDVGWRHGDGPEVRGAGEAVLLAMCGRAAAVPELTGEGVATLRDRLP